MFKAALDAGGIVKALRVPAKDAATLSRTEADKLEDQLRGEGLSVHRRWRYVTVDIATEEHANELASRLRDMASDEAEITIEANPDDIPTPVFVMLESRF